MKELKKLFNHCFDEAEKFSKNKGFKLSKGIMDIPGLADDKGRAPFAEYPVLESDGGESKLRMYFTYEEDISSDIDGKTFYGVTQQYKTPWLRAQFPVGNSDNAVFFRVSKREKNFISKLKDIFNIVPGKKLSVSANLENFYYLFATARENETTENIYVSGIIERLEHFDNLIMIRLDSRDFVADIKCDIPELYSSEILVDHIEKLKALMKEISKFSTLLINQRDEEE